MIRRRSDGRYLQGFPDHVPQQILYLAEQLDQMVDSDAPEVRRLFPTAYANDPEKDAGYHALARDGLIEGRRAAIATIRRTAEEEILSEDELMDWLTVVNDLRLVVGTRLDVSEDDQPEIDEDSPDAELWLAYYFLGQVLHEIVQGLSG